MFVALKIFVKIVFVLLILAAIPLGYIGWRYWDAKQYNSWIAGTETNWNDELHAAVKDAKPFVCTAEAGNFNGAGRTNVHVANGRVRFDTILYPSNISPHMIVRSDGDIFLWHEGEKQGCRFSSDRPIPQVSEPAIQMLMNQHSCVPWFQPDENLFQIPENVYFGTCEN